MQNWGSTRRRCVSLGTIWRFRLNQGTRFSGHEPADDGFNILKIGDCEFAVRSSRPPIRPVVSPFVE
jgi:hypothetical protein